MLHFMVTLFKIYYYHYRLADHTNDVWSHVVGDIQTFLVPTAKINAHDVLTTSFRSKI